MENLGEEKVDMVLKSTTGSKTLQRFKLGNMQVLTQRLFKQIANYYHKASRLQPEEQFKIKFIFVQLSDGKHT